MTTAELIYQHAKQLPEFQAREALDFIDFLAQKTTVPQTQSAACWQVRLCKTAGVQWNGRKPVGGGAACLSINHAKTVAERVLEDHR